MQEFRIQNPEEKFRASCNIIYPAGEASDV
jgi:hypothetical protein